ncbi:glutaredoxin 3 [Methylocella tundrae]|uniref:Glutaredoxin n=1 Tax=Methylocella tundrae TaxID=227605 RepID=A0A8B6M6M6_METTU|nr:glutaredoxin 3 [Methylocella tundrae]VTZ26759.1 glutaredoxin 3 [Methylocella tundrae]VTZ50486.1 glutaredoxin 3 [Methylocella tundrae]
MAQITIYTTATCPYCNRAKALLQKKNFEFTEIPVDNNRELRAELAKRTGRTSVPQIFFGDRHVGGCDDLYELHYDGKLDQLLASQAQ